MDAPWIFRYGYHVMAILCLLVYVAVLYAMSKAKRRNNERSFLDWFMVWPLLIEQHKRHAGKYSNRFIVLGLIVMAVLVIGSIVFFPARR